MSDREHVAAMMGMSAHRFYAVVFPKDIIPIQAMAWLIAPSGEEDPDERKSYFLQELWSRHGVLDDMVRDGNLNDTGSIVCVAKEAVELMIVAIDGEEDQQQVYNRYSRMRNALKELGVNLA